MPRTAVVTKKVVETPAQENSDHWTLVLCPPWEGQTRVEYFYDGSVQTVNGRCSIPKERPEWASRLIKFENYRFDGYEQHTFPKDFIDALGN